MSAPTARKTAARPPAPDVKRSGRGRPPIFSDPEAVQTYLSRDEARAARAAAALSGGSLSGWLRRLVAARLGVSPAGAPPAKTRGAGRAASSKQEMVRARFGGDLATALQAEAARRGVRPHELLRDLVRAELGGRP